ncbi:MAG: type II secretion system protein [Nitrospirae bacterium]|nr:type II secretion system protein [Nitrospirota bacterium]
MDVWPNNHRGFTLIEVLVGIILVSILLAGVISAWNLVSNRNFDLALKQKAIIALNSQTERLTALYRWCNGFSPSYYTSSYGSCTNSGFIVDSTSFNTNDYDDWGKVLYNSSDGLNYVFIDRPRNIVAQLWWSAKTVKDCGLCSASTSCESIDQTNAVCLQISLTYPYRWNGKAPVTDSNLGYPQLLSVQTISAIFKQ